MGRNETDRGERKRKQKKNGIHQSTQKENRKGSENLTTPKTI
jgi:hypothetical protein